MLSTPRHPNLKHPIFSKSCNGRFLGFRFVTVSSLARTFVILAFLMAGSRMLAAETAPSVSALKKLSVEELMSLEVTSVSKRPEKLSKAASAIQVIAGEDIRRSGVKSVPEALRLATNLQVAQVNSSQWAISARGFNNVLANKLLVMIDGRSVYTPLYAGVFWDAQDVLLEDLDRIEVISGPGGTLWGANAVNGVINIITKSARETQGWFVEGGAGNERRAFGALRYGGRLAPDVYFRVYGKGFEEDDTLLRTGADARDDWHREQGGMRIDWDAGGADQFTLQSDYSQSRPNPDGTVPVASRAGNVVARWTHTVSTDSDFHLQFYYDRTWRDFGNNFKEGLRTYDLDWQHRLQLGPRQEAVWGLGFRSMNHEVENLPLFQFRPPQKSLSLYSAFVQDEFALLEGRLRLTLGTKFEHNDYTGLEIQPSGRLAWNPSGQQTFWGSVSRAVRTPARIDRDFYLSATPTIGIFAGGPTFESEKVLAYELGWRVQPEASLSLSLAAFYNRYEDIRSAEPGPPPLNLPITFANGVEGHTCGVELTATHQISASWRLRGGYTFLKKNLSVKPGSQDANRGTAESDDPEHQFQVQSSFDLPGRVELDVIGRYVDALNIRPVPSYSAVDIRLAWKLTEHLELSVIAQNLTDRQHPEYVPSSPSPREIERSVFGKVIWRH